jgi:hypothetical protein
VAPPPADQRDALPAAPADSAAAALLLPQALPLQQLLALLALQMQAVLLLSLLTQALPAHGQAAACQC